jgi:hypothetical protein
MSSSRDAFVSRFIQGRAKLSEIGNYEVRWHNSKSRLELFEYLGFTEAEYHRFVKNPLALPQVMKAAQRRIRRLEASARARQIAPGVMALSPAAETARGSRRRTATAGR